MFRIPQIQYIPIGINAIPGLPPPPAWHHIPTLCWFMCIFLLEVCCLQPHLTSYIKILWDYFSLVAIIWQWIIYVSQLNTVKSNTQSLPVNSSTVFPMTYWNSKGLFYHQHIDDWRLRGQSNCLKITQHQNNRIVTWITLVFTSNTNCRWLKTYKFS